jgi:hypothetical protein
MNKVLARLLAFVLIAATPLMALAATTTPDALLAELSVELTRIRASKSDQPVSSELKPNVKLLTKLNRLRIQSVLGKPDTCSELRDGSCSNAREWIYLFHKLPVGWRGGGAELVLFFDRNEVRDAQWTYSR